MEKQHPDHDKIQDLVSGTLSKSETSELENHLQSCAECRTQLETLQWTKKKLLSIPKPVAEESLKQKVKQRLDKEDRRVFSRYRKIFPYAALFAILIAGALFFASRSEDLSSGVAEDFNKFRSERLSLDFKTDDEPKMEKFFRENGIPFATRVFDLAMMKYDLVGGSVHTLDSRKSALFVYRSTDNNYLLCQMFPGKISDLSEGAAVRQNNQISFHIYKRENLTLVFWQEGDIICVLTSDIPAEEVIQLAFAKAVKV